MMSKLGALVNWFGDYLSLRGPAHVDTTYLKKVYQTHI